MAYVTLRNGIAHEKVKGVKSGALISLFTFLIHVGFGLDFEFGLGLSGLGLELGLKFWLGL